MSQSTGWADNIILAMAPLGIITAIVSAIRVGGPPWLKAIIGRASENRAVAESELMSSTSRKVCELWNGQQIVRVMGSGPIREFIILLRKENGDGGQTKTAAASANISSRGLGARLLNGPSTGPEIDRKMLAVELNNALPKGVPSYLSAYGQYPHPPLLPYLTFSSEPTMRERIFGPQQRRETENGCRGKEAQEVCPVSPVSQSDPTRQGGNSSNGAQEHDDLEKGLQQPGAQEVREDPKEKSDESCPSIVIIRNTNTHTPNLTLNVHNQKGRGELYICATFGIALQLGVLVYHGIAAKYLTRELLKDGNPVASYAFPCTAVGILLLVAGMLICAHTVESSTSETRYQPPDGMEARVVWLQRSGTVNDQAFESCALFPEDPLHLITTSQQASGRMDQEKETTSPGKTLESAETIPKRPQKTPSGQQLSRASGSKAGEVMAVAGTILGICGFIVQFVGLRSMHWSASVVQLGTTIVMTILRTSIRRNLAKNPESEPLVSGHEMDWLAMTLRDPANAP